MAGFQHTEGKGRIFKVRERKSEKAPHMTGTAMWKGEVIQISAWANMGDDGKLQSFGLALQEPQVKEGSTPKAGDTDDWGI